LYLFYVGADIYLMIGESKGPDWDHGIQDGVQSEKTGGGFPV
jgi:hypothetical protein